MKKIPFLIIITFVLFVSCDGLLWNGLTDSGDNLTISIQNPFYQESTDSTTRALALQGKYIYIELARIDDEEMYYLDSNKAISGAGNWQETSWGGHAIVSFSLDLSNITEVESTFKDFPKDQTLSARVLLDVDQSTVESKLDESTDPLCQTFDPDGTDPMGPSWVTISIDDLNNGLINLSIRPKDPINLDPMDWVEGGELGGMSFFDDYLNFPITKPGSLLATTFTSVNPDISAITAKDLAYFSFLYYQGLPYIGTSVSLHEKNGTLIPGNGSLTIETVRISPDSSDPGLFMNYTLITDPITPTVWGVSFGVLYDNNMSSSGSTEIYINWTIPTGITSGDLDFKLIHLDTSGLSYSDLETIDQINSYLADDVLNLDWSDYFSILTGSTFNYVNYAVPGPGMDTWVIVLARDSVGSEFIYGIYYFPLA